MTERKYPTLLRNKKWEYVILATGEINKDVLEKYGLNVATGTVVYDPTGRFEVGREGDLSYMREEEADEWEEIAGFEWSFDGKILNVVPKGA